MIERDRKTEEQLGIEDISFFIYKDKSSLCIVGQIFAKEIKSSFCLRCAIYDNEGDLVCTGENNTYGDPYNYNLISSETFFQGYPFKLSFDLPKNELARIRIIPEI